MHYFENKIILLPLIRRSLNSYRHKWHKRRSHLIVRPGTSPHQLSSDRIVNFSTDGDGRSNFGYLTRDTRKILLLLLSSSLQCGSLWSDFRHAKSRRVTIVQFDSILYGLIFCWATTPWLEKNSVNQIISKFLQLHETRIIRGQ